jgi:hypothetical protein
MRVEFLEADQLFAAELAMVAREARGRVVRDTVDPGPERTLIPKGREAAPDGRVDVLQQILLEAPVPLAGRSQARQRRAEFGDGAGIEIVLARPPADSDSSTGRLRGAGALICR